MRVIRAALLLAAISAAGCVYSTAAQSTAGQTWVMKNSVVSSSFWHCTAESGEPICTQVDNTPAKAPGGEGAPQ